MTLDSVWCSFLHLLITSVLQVFVLHEIDAEALVPLTRHLPLWTEFSLQRFSFILYNTSTGRVHATHHLKAECAGNIFARLESKRHQVSWLT